MFDAAGRLVEEGDGKGALVLQAYDAVSRPIRRWACDGAGQAVTLREWTVYGDTPGSSLTAAQAVAANLLWVRGMETRVSRRLRLAWLRFTATPPGHPRGSRRP